MIPSRQVTRRLVLARRQILAGAVLFFPAPAQAADWPERPIRMIIPLWRAPAPTSSDAPSARSSPRRSARPSWSTTRAVRAVFRDRRGRPRAGRRLHAAADLAGRDGLQHRPLPVAGLRSAQGSHPVRLPAPSPTSWSSRPPTRPRPSPTLVAQARAKPGELTYGSSGVGSSLHMSGVIIGAAHRRDACSTSLIAVRRLRSSRWRAAR